MTAGRLRAEGVEAVVVGSGTPYRATAFPLGGTWEIRVPPEEAEAARIVLELAGEAGNVVPDDEGGELLTADQRATMWFVAAGLLAVLVIALAVATWR
ncbi:hypothetical protein [Tepidiforma sp.]|uniref:hypothetical protein n=1 Tax=Tepidiforma sp. TaxID=2682230 RepID=UPI002ADE1991|nr:hypothetical protein [Tepidiforma sp.]